VVSNRDGDGIGGVCSRFGARIAALRLDVRVGEALMVTESYEERVEGQAGFVGRSLLRIGGLLVLLYLAFSRLLF
jgi:hypothetical protein